MKAINTSPNFSAALQLLLFLKKKKSISYGCMGTDQLKDNEDYDRGWKAQSSILSHYEMIQCEDLLFLLL